MREIVFNPGAPHAAVLRAQSWLATLELPGAPANNPPAEAPRSARKRGRKRGQQEALLFQWAHDDREVLADMTAFENKKMGQSLKPVVVTAYDLEARKPILLSSYNDPDVTAVQAANASSAAPIYFPTASMEDGRWLIDGGIATNNPSLLGYVEAKKLFSTNNIKVLGIGAGLNKRKISGRNSRNWGALGWFRHDILGIMLESSLQNEILKDLIGDDYFRINSPIGNVNRRMDDMSERNLQRIKELADDWWRKFGKKSINFINS